MSNVPNSLEEMQIKHKLERKELQAKIQALKKTATKGDKKKKKEVQEEINKLETALDNKQKDEISSLQQTCTAEETLADKTPEEVTTEDSQESQVRVSKAQKRRQKKATAEKERESRIEEQEVVNRQGPRNKEICAINELLAKRGLSLHSILADGNCLYSAIEHQLKSREEKCKLLDYKALRKLTADHLLENEDNFMPFLTNADSGLPFSEQEFKDYCRKVEKTSAWGGQIEIRALANILKCPIEVVQATGPSMIIGEEFGKEKTPIILTYHRHMYRLGEHYNSVTPRVNSDDDG